MNKKNKKVFNIKGFTMVELLVAMAIMGLLIIMAFPTIRAIQANNTDTKYKEYGSAAISAAKLYVDSYKEDLFESDEEYSYNSISFDQLIKKGLLKDINISDSTCLDSSVDIVKYGDDYSYCLDLLCTTSDGVTKVYSEKNTRGNCSKFSDEHKLKITYVYRNKNNNAVIFKKEKKALKNDDSYKTLTENSFGYNFTSMYHYLEYWKDTATGKTYKPGEIISPPLTKSMTLEAVIQPFKYKVKFNSSITGAGTMSDKDCVYGTSCIINNTFKTNYYTFDKWKYSSNKTFENGVDLNAKINSGEVGLTKNNQTISLTATFRKNLVRVKYNSNGGSLVNPHSSVVTVTNNVIKANGNEVIHTLNYDGQLSTGGLINWNNPEYLNLSRSGYKVKSNEEWNTAANGSGTTFNHSKAYTAIELCPNVKNGDCNVTLYTKWIANPPTCTLTASTEPNAFGWYNNNVTLTLNVKGVATTKGIDVSRYSSNGRLSYSASVQGKNTYYGYVANSGGSNQCSITLKIDKTKPVYIDKDKRVKNGNNEWIMYWKDEHSGLSTAQFGDKEKKLIKRASAVYYCYGTSSNCSRYCTDHKHGGSPGGNIHKGTIYPLQNTYLRKAVIADNFEVGKEKDSLLMQTSRGCNGGDYTVKVEAHICDLAENCTVKYLSYNFN